MILMTYKVKVSKTPELSEQADIGTDLLCTDDAVIVVKNIAAPKVYQDKLRRSGF